MTIDGVTRAYREGTLTPTELVEQAIACAREAASLNTFICLDADGARTQARASTQRWRSGVPLSGIDGIPIAVKDHIDVEGLPTTAGTSFLRRVATKDAEAVARLRRAGAVVLGKTQLSELALAPTGQNASWGPARNPWSPLRDTGGSSSGSAAAVAAGVVPLALGTDLGGSLRIPASWCGVASIKPTFGRVSMRGVLPVCASLDHLGPIGATVEDARLGLEALCGAVLSCELPSRLRVGICEQWWRAAKPEIAERVEAALLLAGVERVAVTLPHLASAFAAGALICAAESAIALEAFTADALSPTVRITLAVGRHVHPAEYREAQRIQTALTRELEQAFASCDVLATPTTPSAAQPYGRIALDEDLIRQRTVFAMPASLAGVPAAQVPCALDHDGLPIGLQAIAPRGEDALALAVAALVERTCDFHPPRQ